VAGGHGLPRLIYSAAGSRMKSISDGKFEISDKPRKIASPECPNENAVHGLQGNE